MKSQKKPDLVILEGPDKAGKSTIYQAFRKFTNYKPLVIDRFIGSNIVYDQLHNREESIDHLARYYRMEDKLLTIFNPLVVYLYAPTKILIDRSNREGDIEKERFDIEHIKPYYEKYLENTILDVIKINTDTCPKIAVVRAIQWELEHRNTEVKDQ